MYWLSCLACTGLCLLPLWGSEADPALRVQVTPSKEVTAMSFEESVQWLEQEAKRLVRACRREMNDGTAAFPPQVGIGYDAFWLRDYSYMLEGCPEAFSAEELTEACRVFVRAMAPAGDGVDCVRYDGTPIYKPGYGSMGENPVADGGPFTINVAWATWRATGDKALLSEVVGRLVACLDAVPRNPASGLVHIQPDRPYDRCPYGFTDTVRKTGDELFTSLLFVQAAGRLAEMLEAAGQGDAGAAWRERAAQVTASCRSVLWDGEAGLFRAATVRCREHDLWGSAFAVHLGVAAPEQAMLIATTLRTHIAGICQRGQFRHLLPGVVWEQACPPGTYQNGGFWGTPTGWFAQTLDLIDPALARRIVIDMVADYRRRGVGEWVLDGHVQLPGYVASATLPLQGIRALLARPR